MNNQIISKTFTSATECGKEAERVRKGGTPCRIQKVEGGFAVVGMNGKVKAAANQQPSVVQPKPPTVQPVTTPKPNNITLTLEGHDLYCNKGQGIYKIEFTLEQASKALEERGYEKVSQCTHKPATESFYFRLKRQYKKVEVSPQIEELLNKIQKQAEAFDDPDLHKEDQVEALEFEPIYKEGRSEDTLYFPLSHAGQMLTWLAEKCDIENIYYEVDIYEKSVNGEFFVSLAVLVHFYDDETPSDLHKLLVEEFR